jgi:DNA-binding SARP family transcriptional activator
MTWQYRTREFLHALFAGGCTDWPRVTTVRVFRLLGPVEIQVDGQLIDTGEPRRRAVLAALLVDAGNVVASTVLIDRVWGATPPEQAHRTLATHVSRIRRVLEQTGSDDEAPVTVLRESGGYRLVLDRGQVDLHRFRELVDQARGPGCAGERQVGLLRQAVALWCGEPLTGVPGDWAQRIRQRLTRERLEATAMWAQAEVEVGNPAVVLAPLTELADENPLMEPLTVTMVRALHAAGRPTEALQRCRAHRQRLVDDFGTDQGPHLRELYTSILREGPEPADEAGAPPGAAPWSVPLQLLRAEGQRAVVPAAPEPAHIRRQGRQVIVGTGMALLSVAIGAAWVLGAGTGQRDPAASRSAPSTPTAFTTPLHWHTAYAEGLGGSPTGDQWASATVSGLTDNDHCASFRLRIGTSPTGLLDDTGVRLGVCGLKWEIEAAPDDTASGVVQLPSSSGVLRASVSVANIVTIAFDGRVLMRRQLQGSYPGRRISPAVYQGNGGPVSLADIRSNATRTGSTQPSG